MILNSLLLIDFRVLRSTPAPSPVARVWKPVCLVPVYFLQALGGMTGSLLAV